jgi:2'-5' RNA ligase
VVKKIFNSLERSLEGIEHEKEERAFIPHVTIGRSKQGVDVSAQAAELKFDIISRAGKVTLFSSVLDPSGPVYTRMYEKVLENKE